MEIKTFSSHEEMSEWLKERAEAAHAGLAKAQADLTWGDHWVQFHDVNAAHIIWGKVSTREEVALGELLSRSDWDEVVATVARTEASLEQGFMYGRAYDRYGPEGELGTTHKAHVWPIEERLFDAAKAAGWDHRNIEDEAMRFLLDLAYRQMRAHVIGAAGVEA